MCVEHVSEAAMGQERRRTKTKDEAKTTKTKDPDNAGTVAFWFFGTWFLGFLFFGFFGVDFIAFSFMQCQSRVKSVCQRWEAESTRQTSTPLTSRRCPHGLGGGHGRLPAGDIFATGGLTCCDCLQALQALRCGSQENASCLTVCFSEKKVLARGSYH